MKQSKKKNQNKANKYKIQQNTQLHLAPMLHEKKSENSHRYSPITSILS